MDIHTTNVFHRNLEAYNSKQFRFIGNEGSTRSSKTYSLMQLIPILCYGEKLEVSAVSPSLPHLKRGARKDFLDILKSWGLYSDKDFNKTDNLYRFPSSGSYIEFFGADEETKLRGPGRDILYMNEANLIPFNSYTQLAIRTRRTIFADWNPADEYNWVYDVVDRPDNKLIHSTYKDNIQNLTPEQVREIEALQFADQNLWNVFGLGLRGTSTETIYTHWKVIDHMPQVDSVCYGLDFGYNHPNVLIKCGFTETANYVEEIIYEKGLTNSDLAYAIKTLGIPKGTPIYCDTARPEAIEEMRRYGLNTQPAIKDVFEGIKMVKSLPLFVTAASTNVVKEIKNYKWAVDPQTQKVKKPEQPVKFMDDAMDAMRYGIYTKRFKPVRAMADAGY